MCVHVHVIIDLWVPICTYICANTRVKIYVLAEITLQMYVQSSPLIDLCVSILVCICVCRLVCSYSISEYKDAYVWKYITMCMSLHSCVLVYSKAYIRVYICLSIFVCICVYTFCVFIDRCLCVLVSTCACKCMSS